MRLARTQLEETTGREAKEARVRKKEERDAISRNEYRYVSVCVQQVQTNLPSSLPLSRVLPFFVASPARGALIQPTTLVMCAELSLSLCLSNSLADVPRKNLIGSFLRRRLCKLCQGRGGKKARIGRNNASRERTMIGFGPNADGK